MNLLVSSVHPANAGLQPALAETLLDYEAAIDGLEDDGSPLMRAVAFATAKDHYGMIGLAWAETNGLSEIVELLSERGP